MPEHRTPGPVPAATLPLSCSSTRVLLAARELLDAAQWVLALIDGYEQMPKPGDDVAESLRAAVGKASGFRSVAVVPDDRYTINLEPGPGGAAPREWTVRCCGVWLGARGARADAEALASQHASEAAGR